MEEKREEDDLGEDSEIEEDEDHEGVDEDEEEAVSVSASASASSPSLSKKALKRLKRKEHFLLAKQAKKAKKKADRQLSKQSKEDSLAVSASPSPSALVPPPHIVQLNRMERKKAKTDAFFAVCKESFEVIIDCAWERDHTESTLASLTQQIMFCYGLNRRYEKPCFLHLSSIGELTRANLSKVAFENWVGVTSSAHDYLDDTDRFSITPCEGKKQLVYLTSDAEEILETLDPSHAYIIGGIVDRNRLKGATYNKAVSQGIRTAKLPIKEYFSLSATHVLTVNHVYEILLKYNILKNWPDTLAAVLPKRKELTKKDVGVNGVEEEENNLDEDQQLS